MNCNHFQDLEGDYTYTSSLGASSIDYIVVTENLIEKVNIFKINEICFSNHNLLSLEMKFQGQIELAVNEQEKYSKSTKISNVAWDEDTRKILNKIYEENETEVILIGLNDALNRNKIELALNLLYEMATKLELTRTVTKEIQGGQTTFMTQNAKVNWKSLDTHIKVGLKITIMQTNQVTWKSNLNTIG